MIVYTNFQTNVNSHFYEIPSLFPHIRTSGCKIFIMSTTGTVGIPIAPEEMRS